MPWLRLEALCCSAKHFPGCHREGAEATSHPAGDAPLCRAPLFSLISSSALISSPCLLPCAVHGGQATPTLPPADVPVRQECHHVPLSACSRLHEPKVAHRAAGSGSLSSWLAEGRGRGAAGRRWGAGHGVGVMPRHACCGVGGDAAGPQGGGSIPSSPAWSTAQRVGGGRGRPPCSRARGRAFPLLVPSSLQGSSALRSVLALAAGSRTSYSWWHLGERTRSHQDIRSSPRGSAGCFPMAISSSFEHFES